MNPILAKLLGMDAGPGGEGVALAADPYAVDDATRQRKLADALRGKAEAAPAQGQMVSGHYVAPHWTQQLQPLLNQAASNFAEQDALAKEAKSKAAIKAAQDEAMSTIPQATPEQAGPIDMRNPNELAAQQPDDMQVFKQYAKMAKIPGMGDIAKEYKAGTDKTATREDNQKAVRENRAMLSLATEQQRIRDAEAKKQAAKEKAEADAKADARDAGYRKERVQMQIDGRIDAAAAAAAAKGAAPPKPVPHAIMKELSTAYDKVNDTARLVGEFKPEYAGPQGAANVAMGKLPFVSTEAGEWWKNYKRESELIERHGLFGAALTGPELKSWKESDISDTMNAAEVQRRLARRQAIVAQHFKDRAGAYQRAGHTGVGEMFPELGGGTPPDAGAAPAAAPAARPAALPVTTAGRTPSQVEAQAKYGGGGGGPDPNIFAEELARLQARAAAATTTPEQRARDLRDIEGIKREMQRSGGGAAPAAAPTVVRTGTRNGKRVQQMSDGTIRDVQ